EPVGDHTVYDPPRIPSAEPLDPDDRPDPDARLVRGPEVELVGRRRLLLRRDDATDGGRLKRGLVDHVPVLGSRRPGAGRTSRRGASAGTRWCGAARAG